MYPLVQRDQKEKQIISQTKIKEIILKVWKKTILIVLYNTALPTLVHTLVNIGFPCWVTIAHWSQSTVMEEL